MFLRLSDADIAKIKKNNDDVIAFEPVAGKAMKGYVVLPKSIYTNDNLFGEWLDKSVKYVSSLPPKQDKRRP